jgi:hypothetical protein
VIISGLTCLYVWQANTIYTIRAGTQSMIDEIHNLDKQNVNLMLAHSRWDSPGYIEAESRRSGMLVSHVTERVAVPAWSQPIQGPAGGAEGRADPIGQAAALLPPSIAVRSRE